MTPADVMPALLGGVLIGVAVSLMLLLNGRVTGVSGIISGLMTAKVAESGWRLAFVLGLLVGGAVLRVLRPESLTNSLQQSLPVIGLSGLLVGFGTVLGGGCTSGHGICGVSRMSKRSIVATVVFMIFGILSATVYRLVFGGPL